MDWVVIGVQVRRLGLLHLRVHAQELARSRVVVAVYQVDGAQRMGMWVSGAIVQAGDVAKNCKVHAPSDAEASVVTSIVGDAWRSLVLLG